MAANGASAWRTDTGTTIHPEGLKAYNEADEKWNRIEGRIRLAFQAENAYQIPKMEVGDVNQIPTEGIPFTAVMKNRETILYALGQGEDVSKIRFFAFALQHRSTGQTFSVGFGQDRAQALHWEQKGGGDVEVFGGNFEGNLLVIDQLILGTHPAFTLVSKAPEVAPALPPEPGWYTKV